MPGWRAACAEANEAVCAEAEAEGRGEGWPWGSIRKGFLNPGHLDLQIQPLPHLVQVVPLFQQNNMSEDGTSTKGVFFALIPRCCADPSLVVCVLPGAA